MDDDSVKDTHELGDDALVSGVDPPMLVCCGDVVDLGAVVVDLDFNCTAGDCCGPVKHEVSAEQLVDEI